MPPDDDPELVQAVVVIDNNPITLTACEQILTRVGYRVGLSGDGSSGLAQAAHLHPVAAVVDLNMPGMDGLEVITRLRAGDDTMAIVAITGYPTLERAVGALKQGADDFLSKPFSPGQLRRSVEGALATRRTRTRGQRAARAAKESP